MRERRYPRKKDKEKTSQLVFDMRLTRKLLKMNGEVRFCPYCGKPIEEGCECHKGIIIDVKPKREAENETVAVFHNNPTFRADYDQLLEEEKAKAAEEPEQLSIDFD